MRNSLWNLLPRELWKIFAAHSLGWRQTFLHSPGVGHHGVAQLWPRWLVFGLQPVTGCLPENESERPQGCSCVWRTEENVHSYFKARGCTSCSRPAAHKNKQDSPKERTFSKQIPLHFKSCFQTEKKGGQKGFTCAYGKGSSQLLRKNPVPAHSCHCKSSLERELGTHRAQLLLYAHTHTQIFTQNHVYTFMLTFTHTQYSIHTYSMHTHKNTHITVHTH